MTARIEAQDDEFTCAACGMPAVLTGRGWAHAEAADDVFCMVLRGIAIGSEEDAT